MLDRDPQRISAVSITFSSSRALPGQLCSSSRSRAEASRAFGLTLSPAQIPQ